MDLRLLTAVRRIDPSLPLSWKSRKYHSHSHSSVGYSQLDVYYLELAIWQKRTKRFYPVHAGTTLQKRREANIRRWCVILSMSSRLIDMQLKSSRTIGIILHPKKQSGRVRKFMVIHRPTDPAERFRMRLAKMSDAKRRVPML
jgi:hypothetical protein